MIALHRSFTRVMTLPSNNSLPIGVPIWGPEVIFCMRKSQHSALILSKTGSTASFAKDMRDFH